MLMVLVLGLSVLALAVAWGLRGYVLRQDNGTADMRKISDAIQEGAEAFLRRQYRTIGTLSGALEPQQGAPDRAAGRGGERAVRGRDELVRRGAALHGARGPALRADQDPPHDRGLRLRRVVRGAVRAAGRRDLHQGRRRRRRSRREGGGGDPRRRSAQPGRYRGPGGRQRGRLRGSRRRPVRV